MSPLNPRWVMSLTAFSSFVLVSFILLPPDPSPQRRGSKKLYDFSDVLCLFHLHDRLCYLPALLHRIIQLGAFKELVHDLLGAERTFRTAFPRPDLARINRPVLHTDRQDRRRQVGAFH